MAKSKTKLKPRGNPESASGDDSDEFEDTDSPVESPEKKAEAVARRPLLFAISLALFIGWLLFLAYVAYKVNY